MKPTMRGDLICFLPSPLLQELCYPCPVHLPVCQTRPTRAQQNPCPARALLARVAHSLGWRLCIFFLPAAPSRCSSSI